MNRPVLYRLTDLSFEYRERGLPGPVAALSGIDLEIREGEWLAVAGANASGKTTLALLLAGLLRPTSGEIHFGGVPGSGHQQPFHGVGMLFQNPENTFVAPTLEEDVAFGPENEGLPPEEIRRRVDEALARVGLSGRELSHPADLSGGQQQMAALAGAMARDPRVLIADEATAYLDAPHRRLVLDRLAAMNRQEGMTVVMTTQEADEIWPADRLVVLERGRVGWQGPPADLLSRPGECRRLGIDADPLAELCRCLEERGLAVPAGRPTVESLEEWLVRRG